MQRVKVEVGRDDIRIDIVCRMLNRCKIKHLIIIRHNNHATRMLSGRTFYSGTAFGKAVFLRFMQGLSTLGKIVFDIAVGGLIRQSTGCSRFKYMTGTKQFLSIFVRLGLVLSREV
ncbi:secreted protein [Clostridium sp. CAG:242]|nr:secreted protein [Clostridium sp. CAG:242]